MMLIYAPINSWLVMLTQGWQPCFDPWLFHHSKYSVLLWRPE